MSSAAQHLETLEALCARPFPERPEHTGGAGAPPGHHLVVLSAGGEPGGERDEERELVEDQFESEREALSLLLEARGWGPAQHMALWSVAVRAHEHPGDVPAPWRTLAETVPDLFLWRRAGRWAGLGIARADPELPVRLIAFATATDPP